LWIEDEKKTIYFEKKSVVFVVRHYGSWAADVVFVFKYCFAMKDRSLLNSYSVATPF
jgi:hypothetical protein